MINLMSEWRKKLRKNAFDYMPPWELQEKRKRMPIHYETQVNKNMLNMTLKL